MSSQHDRERPRGAGAVSARAGPAPLGGGFRPAPERGTGVPALDHRGRTLGEGFGATERTDRWWGLPALQIAGALLAVGYAAVIGPRRVGAEFGPYHSPFHAGLFRLPAPGWLSPLDVNLAVPALFRATCYYFRRSYSRSFFGDPPACAVGGLRRRYRGETKLPFVLQNLHRYLLYLALALMLVHWWNVLRATNFDGRFGIGFGTLLLFAATALLTLYTISCHALRHLVGGNLDCFSCAKAGGVRYRCWSLVSALNGHHMGYFWWSLYAVCAADLYIRLCSAGIIHDGVFYPYTLFDSVGGTGL